MKGLVPQLDFSLAQDVRGVYTEFWPAPGHSNARLTDDDLNRRELPGGGRFGPESAYCNSSRPARGATFGSLPASLTSPMPLPEIPVDRLSFAAYRLPGEDGQRRQPSAFLSLAHWFEAEKFRAFAPEVFDQVILCPSGKEARKLTRKNATLWRSDWRAVRLRALACGMVYAARSDPDAQRWSGSPQEIAALLAPLNFPERFALGAAVEFVRLRDAPRVAFLGASAAPNDVVGKKVNLVHKRSERAWRLTHWQGRHGSWKIHDWALQQYVPIDYLGHEGGRLTPADTSALARATNQVAVFERRQGRTMDAVLRSLRQAKAHVDLELYSAGLASELPS